jgi:hypothetical protein
VISYPPSGGPPLVTNAADAHAEFQVSVAPLVRNRRRNLAAPLGSLVWAKSHLASHFNVRSAREPTSALASRPRARREFARARAWQVLAGKNRRVLSPSLAPDELLPARALQPLRSPRMPRTRRGASEGLCKNKQHTSPRTSGMSSRKPLKIRRRAGCRLYNASLVQSATQPTR